MNNLKRQLKLYDVFSIAAGAMISSGLFILPGLAYAKSGTMVIVAYFLAGILVLPSIFSKAELATAMPKAGGTYFFIGRSLGSGLGTLGGISAWFSLSFKTAFALLGIGAFLSLIFPSITILQIKLIATFFALFFTFTNLVSVHHSGRLQTVMVTFLIALLVIFIGGGLSSISISNFSIPEKISYNNIFITAGMIFISFGGVTKVASVAEEIKNPSRNIPLGMLLAFGIVTSLYVSTIFVTVGILGKDLGSLGNYSLTPISDAAAVFWGKPGKMALGIAALLAFISTANAGIMAASRTPMAMSRDKLLPNVFNSVNKKFKTPHNSIILTSAFVIAIIFLPLEILVKTASTMMILLFIFVNISLIIMRESRIQNYHPKFKSPLYPWIQIIAIVVYAFIIIQMGKYPLLISAAILGAGLLLYWLYGRIRSNRDSALIRIVEKVTDRKISSYSLESELKEIIRERDNIKLDKFDKIIENSIVLDIEERMDKESFFHLVAENISDHNEFDSNYLFEKIHNREKESSTVISEHIAIPHVIIEGEKKFQVILVRAKKGIIFTDEADNIQIIFVIIGSKDERTFHLKALAALAQIIQSKDFEAKWLAAKNKEELRDIILLGERRR